MKSKKIIFLTKYPRKGASSRLRTFQFIPNWERAGYHVTVSSFFNDNYLDNLYVGKRIGILNLLFFYLRRFRVLFTVSKYDFVFVEKELFPFLPSFPELVLSKLKGYLVDYDDAIFHNYDNSELLIIRNFMPNKISRVMKMANKVIVGNEYLAMKARASGAKSILRLPTVIDPNRYQKKVHSAKLITTIGWIGPPVNLKYLESVVPFLEKIQQNFFIKLLLITGKELSHFSGNQELIPWTEEGEADGLLKIDIGIMPLPDNPWERGKCAYKLIQYMACGLPVVASPVGMNREVVQHGVNGFLADTEEEWVEFLGQLISDWEMREDFGTKGYELVMEKYTLAGNFQKMLALVSTPANENAENT